MLAIIVAASTEILFHGISWCFVTKLISSEPQAALDHLPTSYPTFSQRQLWGGKQTLLRANSGSSGENVCSHQERTFN
jgi:hypothetical protein